MRIEDAAPLGQNLGFWYAQELVDLEQAAPLD